MNAERKYKDSYDLQPKALVVLSSNMLWSPKDSSTGLQRRILYIPVTTVPPVKDNSLFNYDLLTNFISGTLAESLPGLVNWALSNPEENLKYLMEVNKTNSLISPDVLDKTNPLIDWIKSFLTFELDCSARVGSKSLNPDIFLYPNYILFCKEYGYKSLPFNNFSDLLVQQLNTLYSPLIQKKKTEIGMTISNIRLNKSPNLTFSPSTSTKDSSGVMSEFVGHINNLPSPRYPN